MQKAKVKDNALYRIQANKRDQNFATRRLLRDYKEIEENKITTVGVTAKPLPKNFFEWHANIKGPEGTIYEGGVFHLSLKIPENYPHQPPTVELLTSLPHPNVFGSYICLDMLNPYQDGQGWTSAYTIQSILMQLQSFLFQKQLKRDEKTFKNEVKYAIERANEFKCKACNHGGKLSAWPKFDEKENDESSFQLVNFDENKEFFKEIICYHTKQSFKDSVDENQDTVKGQPLGLGLKITKIPRTGAIQQAITTLDYISIKAFIKEGIRWSCNNEKFTTWFPLYFGSEDNKDRSLKLGSKAISMIMTNSTRRFKPEYILEVFPKIIISQVLLLADEKRHPSINMIRNLTHIHTMFLLFMEEYPELYDVIEEKLQNFINEEQKRVKEALPNLSLVMTYLLVAPKTKLKEILTPYHLESLDRQVFWILRSVPEIFELPNQRQSQKDQQGQKNTGLNAERAKLTFKCQIISNQMFSLFKLYISTVRGNNDTPQGLLQAFESNYSRLSDKIENEMQKNIKKVKKIDNYDDFYEFIGFPKKSLEELNGLLLQAYKNSAAKKYHGNINEIHTLPTTKDQMEKLYQNIPKIEDFYEIKTSEEIVKDKKEFKYIYKLKKEMKEENWKEAAVKRWIWLEEELKTNPNITPTELLANNYKNYNLNKAREPPQIFENIKENWVKKDTKVDYPFIQICEQSWHSLFISLDIQDTLYYMNENPDFSTFYQKLAVSSGILTFLTIPIIKITQIKSGYHFLTALLTKLTNLKYITVTGTSDGQTNFPMKAITSFNKGINNFIKGKGSLQGIFFNGLLAQGNSAEITDKIFSPLAQMKELVSIKFVNNNFLQQLNAPKSLGKIIAELKNLQELILSNNVFYNPTQAKEIADSLMRAKKLKYIDISQNSSMGFQGLASIIYNLAFSTNLYYLNVSKNYCSGNISEVAEALYKLLKINASIELLDLSLITNLNNNLTKDFFQCLGDIPSLRYVDFSSSGQFNSTNLGLLGKAVAFSARKNNALENINLKCTITNFSSVENQFYENMRISDHDYETWYGDPIKASKMKGSDYTKTYYNNLKSLQFDQAQNFASYFNITDFQKYNRKDTNFMKLVTQSPNITTLNLQSCQLKKQDAELFSLVLDPTREIKDKTLLTKIKVLDLSKNQIGKEGAKVFAKIFEVNDILEVVDLSKNQIGVSGAQEIAKYLEKNKALKFLNLFNNKIGYDGAKAFADTLKFNTTLEFLELGHNRIRKEGLKEIGESLSQNAQTKLQVLGLRFNFLGEDGITEFQKKTAKVSSLKEIYVKNNSVGEYGLQQIKKVYDNLKSTLKIDLLEKLDYLTEEKLEKTIYIHPVPGNNVQIKQFFEEQQNCGIILDIRVRFGPKWPNRTQQQNKFAMIEFADTKSVDRALMVAAKKKANICGMNFRIYKAGTGTFIYMKKSTKQKKAETSKTNFLKLGEGETNAPVFERTRTFASRGGRGGKRGGRPGRR